MEEFININSEPVLFWAYRHINGHIQVRKYYDRLGIEDALDSDFVEDVAGPYPAHNRKEAEQIAISRLGKSQ